MTTCAHCETTLTANEIKFYGATCEECEQQIGAILDDKENLPADVRQRRAITRFNARHRKISEAAQKYHDLAEIEPFPRPQWIDAWNDLKNAITVLREAERDTR